MVGHFDPEQALDGRVDVTFRPSRFGAASRWVILRPWRHWTPRHVDVMFRSRSLAPLASHADLKAAERQNGDGSKAAKIIKKVILHSITLTFRQCDGG